MNIKKCENQHKHVECYDLTFVTLAFNQERLIQQHLNSLLFLRKNFLFDKTIELIISDDCSNDATVDLISKWVAVNGVFFDNLILIKNEYNQGTAKSFVNAARRSSGMFIKFLAGDDVYLENDISKILPVLHESDLLLTPLYYFKDNDISNSLEVKNRKSQYAISAFVKRGNIRNSASLNSGPETPGLFIRREVLTEDVLKFVCQFDLIEDRAMWIKIFETNSAVRISALFDVFVGYRQHSGSVSKSKSKSKSYKRYKNDQFKLTRYQLKNCQGMPSKIRHLYYLFYEQFEFPFKKYFNFQAVWFNLKYLIANSFSNIKSKNKPC